MRRSSRRSSPSASTSTPARSRRRSPTYRTPSPDGPTRTRRARVPRSRARRPGRPGLWPRLRPRRLAETRRDPPGPSARGIAPAHTLRSRCGRPRRSSSSASSRRTTTATGSRPIAVVTTSYLVEPARELAAQLGDLGEPHLFRPYNDTRFHMRPPIKEQLGLAIGYGGAGGYYVELSLDGLLVAAGLHHPASDQLERYRAAIDDGRRAASFERAVRAARARGPRAGPARAEARAARLSARPPAHRPAAHEGDHGVPPPRARAVAAQAASADARIRKQLDGARPLVRWLAQARGPTAVRMSADTLVFIPAWNEEASLPEPCSPRRAASCPTQTCS